MNNGPATPAADEANDFDRAFALDDAALDAASQTGPKESGEPAPAPAAAATPPDQGTPAVPDGGGGGGNPTDPPGTSVSTEDDWISSLPEDAQARIKAEREARRQEAEQQEVRYRALHGRLAPTQQALSDAQRRLAQTPAASPAQASAPVQQPGQTADSYFDSPAFKAYEADFPGDAKVMREMAGAQQQAHQHQIASLEGRINQLAQRLESTEQVTSRAAVQTEAEKLTAKHPDWQEINESPEFWDYFDDFRAAQPKSVRAMYYDENQLKQMFCDSEFTGAMIDGYKASKAAGTPATVPATTTTPESTQQQPAQPTAQAARVAMGVAPAVRAGGTVPASVPLESMSEPEQFEHLWKTVER